jgi:hypothetical protein
MLVGFFPLLEEELDGRNKLFSEMVKLYSLLLELSSRSVLF